MIGLLEILSVLIGNRNPETEIEYHEKLCKIPENREWKSILICKKMRTEHDS